MTRELLIRSIESVGRLGVGLALLILVLWAGCGRSTTAVGSKDEKATAIQKGDNVEVTVEGKHGEEAHVATGEGGVALPGGFPADVPLYPKATIVTTTTIDKAMHVSLKTFDSAKQIEAFYKEQGGWKLDSSLDMPQMKMLQGTKNGRTLTVVISAESDYTVINLSVTEEKQP